MLGANLGSLLYGDVLIMYGIKSNLTEGSRPNYAQKINKYYKKPRASTLKKPYF